MEIFYADDICQWSERELWRKENDEREHRLIFGDGEITTTWQQTIVSWYFWEGIRDYPLTPLSMRMHVANDFFSPGLEGKLENRVTNAIIEAYPKEDLENIQAAMYRGKNLSHNAFTSDGEAWNDTVDALTMLEIWEHPEIQKINDNIEPTQAGVNRAYGEITKVISNAPELRGNSMGTACHIGQTKLAQFHQVIGKRAFCSEVDQGIFPTMANAGFAEGVHRASFFAMISRDASKALQATDDPVKQAEYYNRELQLFTFVVKQVWDGDCGTTETIPWEVKKKELDKILPGKFYVGDDGKLQVIKPGDDHLVGKIIQMRHVAGCWHPKDGVRCSTCIGQLARSVQKSTNLGHAGTVTQNEKVSQDVISTKHVLRSADSEGFEIDPFYNGYMVNAGEMSEVMLSQDIWNEHVFLEIQMAYLPRLSDINAMDNFTNNDLTKISGIEDITVLIKNGEGFSRNAIIPTSHGSYRPYLTEAFIKHMKDYGFENLGKKIRVDLMNWNSSESILKFPDRHSSTLEMMMELKSNLFMSNKESKDKLRYDLTDPDIMSMALTEICNMTNQKFSVNLAIVELVLYAMMSRDPDNGDYRLPKKGTGRRFDTKGNIMSGRSLSAKAAYEKQFSMVQSPSSYLNKLRSNHPFDYLLLDVDGEMKKKRF